ncbi:MAG: GNAT family N-acetyltransferase [Phyllobacterium sp.]
MSTASFLAASGETRNFTVGRTRADSSLMQFGPLATRSMEPNIFFDPLFLFPAVNALNPKRTEILHVQDTSAREPCFLLPFEIVRPGLGLGPSVIRGWSTAFSPLGTPLLMNNRPADILGHVLDHLADPTSGLPDILLLRDIRVGGPFAQLLQSVAQTRNLPLAIVDREERPFLESQLDGETYLREAIGAHHRRDYGRLWRRLSRQGELAHRVACTPNDVEAGFEDFLALEASGWKGRKRTALAANNTHASFAREAIRGLAREDRVRIHTLTLDGKPVAALVVFAEGGEAWTWKTAYDEQWKAFSPGTLLMIEVVKRHLADPGINRTDSCAIADHPVMTRLFREREAVATLILGLRPDAGGAVSRTIRQLQRYRRWRIRARQLRNRMASLVC